jgi:hypothetical protein
VRWPHWTNALLGLWLASSPSAFELSQAAVRTNAVVTGALVVALSLLSLRHDWAKWGVALTGVWLMLAPLALWAREAVVYESWTVLGVLLVAFSVLVPGEPGRRGLPGPDAPPGWTYNPSSFPQRAPIIAFAFLSYLVARHLTAYQLGYVPVAWDPFFGDGTRRVLESEVSKSFPVSDAGLGAVSYLVEALSGFMGDGRRWRTMPWMVVLFGILIVPLGVVSITLVVLQPVAVGAWCSLCLLTAVLMLLMVSPAFDEVVATGQFLQWARRNGLPFWRTFFRGGAMPGVENREADTHDDFAEVVGFARAPTTLLLASGVGVVLMFAPSLLGLRGALATACYVVGPLAVTFAVIAMAEVARSARWLVAALAAILLGVAVLLGAWPVAAAALALGALSLPRGEIKEKYGGWERFVR